MKKTLIIGFAKPVEVVGIKLDWTIDDFIQILSYFFFKLQSTAENSTSLNLSKRRDSRDNNNDNMDPVYDSENLNPEDVHKSLRYVLLFLVLMYSNTLS